MSHPGPKPKPLLERVAARVVAGENGCHVWQGCTDERGYPVLGVGSSLDGTRGMKRVHVALWEHHHGKLARGLVRHHSCGNKLCVNLEHLAVIGHGEHSRLHDSAAHARAGRRRR